MSSANVLRGEPNSIVGRFSMSSAKKDSVVSDCEIKTKEEQKMDVPNKNTDKKHHGDTQVLTDRVAESKNHSADKTRQPADSGFVRNLSAKSITLENTKKEKLSNVKKEESGKMIIDYSFAEERIAYQKKISDLEDAVRRISDQGIETSVRLERQVLDLRAENACLKKALELTLGKIRQWNNEMIRAGMHVAQ